MSDLDELLNSITIFPEITSAESNESVYFLTIVKTENAYKYVRATFNKELHKKVENFRSYFIDVCNEIKYSELLEESLPEDVFIIKAI